MNFSLFPRLRFGKLGNFYLAANRDVVFACYFWLLAYVSSRCIDIGKRVQCRELVMLIHPAHMIVPLNSGILSC